ncbi:MAG: V-type ATP synthase subunit D [Actinobacteria bacterium]|nr:V-type ATP synthase subunit D [Actinomycetota bacterium]
MLANVNPTRMELLRLKKRLTLAERGHKLLKDKRDELMRQLLGMIDDVKTLRLSIENEFQSILEGFMLAKAKMGPYQTEQALLIPKKKIAVTTDEKNLMSVRVPVFKKEVTGDIISYGFLNTTGEMDISLIKFEKFIEALLSLAEKEKTVQLLANEIEETRRRVNALEYRLIPEFLETIKFITMKLAETERSNTIRLMKVKEIVRSH